LTKAFRNIPGVDTISVHRLNLLKLAPGGHVGRFCVWTESAIKQLDGLYGTWRKESEIKKGYNLPLPKMTNTDLSRLLKSDEIQRVIRAPVKTVVRARTKLNPLKNTRALAKLNPYAIVTKRAAFLKEQKVREKQAAGKKAAPSKILALRKTQREKAKKAKVEQIKKADPRLKKKIEKLNKRAAAKKEQRKKNAVTASAKKAKIPPPAKRAPKVKK